MPRPQPGRHPLHLHRPLRQPGATAAPAVRPHRRAPPPDAQTANQRVFRLNDTVFAAYNSRDDDGQFALDLQDLATARTRRVPDPMRTLIDAFAHGHAIIPGRRAAQNLDWLLKVAGNLPRK